MLQAEHSLELHLPYIAWLMRCTNFAAATAFVLPLNACHMREACMLLLMFVTKLEIARMLCILCLARFRGSLGKCRGRKYTLVPIMVGALDPRR